CVRGAPRRAAGRRPRRGRPTRWRRGADRPAPRRRAGVMVAPGVEDRPLDDGPRDDGPLDEAGKERPEPDQPAARPWHGPSPIRWVLFAVIALSVVVLDQLAKSWIVANLAPSEGIEILGDWLRIVHGENSGILFGMLPQSAGAFAVVSLI